MQSTALRFTKTASSLPVSELERNVQGWLLDCEIRQHSSTTIATRKLMLEKFLWFLREQATFKLAQERTVNIGCQRELLLDLPALQ